MTAGSRIKLFDSVNPTHLGISAGATVEPLVSIKPSKVTWLTLLSAFSTSGSGGSSADQCDSKQISFVLISIAQRGGPELSAPGRRYSTREPCRVACTDCHGWAGGWMVTNGKCSLPRPS